MGYLSGRLYVNTNKYNSQPRSKSWESRGNLFLGKPFQWALDAVKKGPKIFHRFFTRYEMVSLSLHETNPGHHLQGSYSIEQADWPMFRKVMILTTLMALCSSCENFGLFPCLMFSTDHGGQNIQPSALKVPNQHWLCRGEHGTHLQFSVIN